jgi:hypothetical protein
MVENPSPIGRRLSSAVRAALPADVAALASPSPRPRPGTAAARRKAAVTANRSRPVVSAADVDRVVAAYNRAYYAATGVLPASADTRAAIRAIRSIVARVDVDVICAAVDCFIRLPSSYHPAIRTYGPTLLTFATVFTKMMADPPVAAAVAARADAYRRARAKSRGYDDGDAPNNSETVP